MDIINFKNTKYFLIFLIIFSIPSFGKNFKELFVIYEPIQDSTLIEKSINNAFNTMIYRLSGSASPSNIWRIINAGNARKDFITSYSIKNIDDKTFLQVNFDKNLLIEKFEDLKIPIVSNSRPVLLLIIKIDSGNSLPYFLSSHQDDNYLNELIRNTIKNYSNIRGVFLELPELDLNDRINLLRYEKLIDTKQYISSKYTSDKVIMIDLTKTGLNSWSLSGDINFQYAEESFSKEFIEDFNEYIENEINNMLEKNLIDISNKYSIKLKINNIRNLQNYKDSRNIIENLIGIGNLKIEMFEIDNISYTADIFGNFETIENQFAENSFFDVVESSVNEEYLHLAYKK